MPQQVIYLHRAAPPKPAPGAPCNGCGVCCALQPCPAGALLSRRWTGPCSLLRWDDIQGFYRCGLMTAAARRTPGLLRQLLERLVKRWIAAGVGCDCSVQLPD